jgi:hypothetical protein
VPDVFDHASIPATLRACFAPDQAPLTDRDRYANTFHSVVADGQAVAGVVPRRLPGDDPHSPDDPPPLRWSSGYLPDDGGIAVDAVATSTAPPPDPTEFDLRLASMGERMAKDLERSRRAGVLRVEKIQARETEEDVAADASAAGSMAAGSPLEIFVDSARVTRATGSWNSDLMVMRDVPQDRCPGQRRNPWGETLADRNNQLERRRRGRTGSSERRRERGLKRRVALNAEAGNELGGEQPVS